MPDRCPQSYRLSEALRARTAERREAPSGETRAAVESATLALVKHFQECEQCAAFLLEMAEQSRPPKDQL